MRSLPENPTKPRRARLAWAASLGLAALSAAFPVQGAFAASADQPSMNEAEVIRRVLPSVVNITIWKPPPGVPAQKTDGAKVAVAAGAPEDADGVEPTQQFYGSGFVVDPSGLILTNRHVVEGASDISVTFADGTQAEASLCAICGLVDLAIVKVSGRKDLPAITWGDSEKLHVGDRVLAIGNPLGVGESVSGGIVSALHRHVSDNPFDDFIQTDAAINHGNSGGVLVDQSGAVIGVNTAFLSDRSNGGSLGIGFAIPSFEAKHGVSYLRDCSDRPPGWIGVTVQAVTADIAQTLALAKPTGSIVTGVAAGSPAAKAGIQEGDVLETVNGNATPTPVPLLGVIAMSKVGAPIRVGYWRDGHAGEATAIVAPWPGLGGPGPGGKVQLAAMRAMSMHSIGIHFADRPAGSGPNRVVVASVGHGSGASDAGLRPGDVVLRVDRQPAASADLVQSTLRDAAQAGRHAVLILVESGGRRRFVSMPLGMS